MASSDTEWSGWRSLTTTFFNVSAAVHGRSARARSDRALSRSTSVWIVGVSGVSTTRAGGASSMETGGGAGTRTASVFAA